MYSRYSKILNTDRLRTEAEPLGLEISLATREFETSLGYKVNLSYQKGWAEEENTYIFFIKTVKYIHKKIIAKIRERQNSKLVTGDIFPVLD